MDTDSNSFKALKERVKIDTILAHYGLHARLQRHGDRLRGPCPLHGGDNPTAFSVQISRGLWHCFTACGGGDSVELVRKIHHCSYDRAAQHLKTIASKTHNTTPPLTQSNTNFRPFTRSIPLDPRHPFLQEVKKIAVHTAARFQAGTTTSSPFLAGTVAVRLHDFQANPLGYCGRDLNPDKPKWRFPKNFPKTAMLYNAHRAQPWMSRGIILVECPWAAMRLTQAQWPNTLPALGTTLSQAQLSWLAKAPAILLLLDGDRAGKMASQRLAAILSARTKTFVHLLPDDLEPEDLRDSELTSIPRNYFF